MTNRRLKVYNTPSGLRKEDLIKNSRGRIISKRASLAAKRNNNLGKYL